MITAASFAPETVAAEVSIADVISPHYSSASRRSLRKQAPPGGQRWHQSQQGYCDYRYQWRLVPVKYLMSLRTDARKAGRCCCGSPVRGAVGE